MFPNILPHVLLLVTVAISGGALELLHQWYKKRSRYRQIEKFYAWRERQQSKWRVKHPSVQYEETPKWDGDIPVFASKEKK